MSLIDELIQYELTRYIPHTLPADADVDLTYWDKEDDVLIYHGPRYGTGSSLETLWDKDNEEESEPSAWDLEPEEESEDDYVLESLEQMREYFGLDAMSDEEFLELRFCDILHLTPGQMKFLNVDVMNHEDFSLQRFMMRMDEEAESGAFSDPQKRIRYCTACVALDTEKFRYGGIYNGRYIREVDEYVRRIASEYELGEAGELLRLLDDYYICRPNALLMNQERKENGQQTFDYTLTPKPSRIKDLHDKAARDHAEIKSRKLQEQSEIIDSCIKEVISSEPYRKMLYETNSFAVIPADSAKKIVEEGKYLRHCVASYIPDFYTGDIFLYFLREKKALDTPYFTLEVKQKGTRYALTQCYTFDDATDKSPECEAFLRQWCSKKRIKIDCEL